MPSTYSKARRLAATGSGPSLIKASFKAAVTARLYSTSLAAA